MYLKVTVTPLEINESLLDFMGNQDNLIVHQWEIKLDALWISGQNMFSQTELQLLHLD